MVVNLFKDIGTMALQVAMGAQMLTGICMVSNASKTKIQPQGLRDYDCGTRPLQGTKLSSTLQISTTLRVRLLGQGRDDQVLPGVCASAQRA